MPKVTPSSSRLVVLDYLRGFFIIVIIIDHLSRWPSVFGALTGQAWLWVTAAEGFVIISGLLVGYIRGFKNRTAPMVTVTKKLVSRAALLYAWSIIATLAYSAIIWNVPLVGGAPGMPIPTGDWWGLITAVVTMEYTYVWVHFLTLYAIFLAVSPLAIWLLRRNMAKLVISISLLVLVIGWQTQIESLQWQALFFIPSAVGYSIDSIRKWWQNLPRRHMLTLVSTIIGLTVITVAISVIYRFTPAVTHPTAEWVNGLFDKDTISIWRLLMAFLWFSGFLLAFSYVQPFIAKYLAWLLVPIGTHSLTAYILHGLALCTVSYFVVSGSSIVINSLLGIAAIMITWGLLAVPLIRKIVPS
jgi:hypothetical protein